MLETKLFFKKYLKMEGEKDLNKLLKSMKPILNEGEYVFCTIKEIGKIDLDSILLLFKEEEGLTVILEKNVADSLSLDYSFIASWITLTVHSSLEAVGLTAAFSKALSDEKISCNVVAAFYHDHIFVDKDDSSRAMTILEKFSN
jgi:hypothetical protein